MDPAHTLPADMPTACSCSGLSVQLPVLHYPHLSLTLLVINRQSGSVNNRGHCGRTGQRVWSLPMVPVYGPCVWSPCMVTVYGHCEWSPCMVTVLITVYACMVSVYGQRVWDTFMTFETVQLHVRLDHFVASKLKILSFKIQGTI